MNKKLLTIGIILVFVIVGLSGCVSNEENRFVGKWRDEGGIITRVFSDGTVIEEYQGEAISGKWELENNQLVVTYEDGSTTYRYDYKFSDNDNTLFLTKSSITQILTKISNNP